MTSFLRDLYVPIPGHGSNRINAAYAYGGMNLLEQTIEENFAVTVDGAIEVDFDQFSRIIDLLGGISLQLRQDEADTINRETGSTLTEGLQHLTGHQALTYSRIRSLDPDGDFSRTGRQRKVMEAIVSKCRSAGPSTLIPLLDQMLPMITTDMQEGDILGYAAEILPIVSELQVVTQHIPAEGTYTYDNKGTEENPMYVIIPDIEANRKILEDLFN
jgi:LCP family protein required for cell wall assembly